MVQKKVEKSEDLCILRYEAGGKKKVDLKKVRKGAGEQRIKNIGARKL